MPGSEGGRFNSFDVVIVPFPYSDRLAEKRRPALVISNRRLQSHGIVWLAMITSAGKRHGQATCRSPIAGVRGFLPPP
jgi:mRNA interferase MazF